MKKQEFFMRTALMLSLNSKCVSKKVGAIIVKEGRIISTGYNGTPKGYVNCCDVHDPEDFDREEHHEWSNKNEIHAEMNALLFAAKNGTSVKGADIYCTLQPCNNCLKNLLQTGIKNIYYLKEYDKFIINDEMKRFMYINGIGYHNISFLEENIMEIFKDTVSI